MTQAPLSLPYSFDTRRAARMSLLALWGAAPVLIIAYVLMETVARLDGSILMLLRALFPFVAIVDVLAGYYLFRHAQGATGTISTHMVEVIPDRFLGMHSGAPEGTFALQQFESISLHQTSVKSVNSGQVSLTGKNKAHTIKLGNLPADKAEALAAFLSKELNLPRVNS